MKIVPAKTAGFCMGVKRALDIALKSGEERGGRIYTHGPLIHNVQAVDVLRSRGVEPLDSFENCEPGCVVIRAHGISPEEADLLRQRGFELVDATCPHVKRSQETVAAYSSDGYQVIIVGDRDHAEIAGIEGFCSGLHHVISTEDEAGRVRLEDKAIVIAQTTFNEGTYRRIAEILERRGREVVVVNSICRATHNRQAEAARLGALCDAVIVVGGRHSANTRRLAEIASSSGRPTFHVETADEIDLEVLRRFETVGVTAGASTPSWITRGVIERLESLAPAKRFRVLRQFFSGVVKSNLYSSVAAVALTFACCVLQGITFDMRFLLVAFCYIFSTSMLNRVFDEREDKLHIPGRVLFYRKYAARLVVTSLAHIAASLVASMMLPHREITTLFLLIAYALGLTYSMRLVPRRILGGRIRRLKDIPGSKDIFGAAGWTAVAVFVPFFSAGLFTNFSVNTLAAAVVAFAMVLIKSILVDFADIYSDRRLGRETLPVALGEEKTNGLLFALVGLVAAVFAISPWLLLFGGDAAFRFRWLGLFMLAGPAFLLVSLWLVRRRAVSGEIASILLADGNLLLLGLICAVFGAIA